MFERTEEPFFLEEEKEKRLESLFESGVETKMANEKGEVRCRRID